jgi:hypothetical protein
MLVVLECLKGDILTGVVFLTQVAICGSPASDTRRCCFRRRPPPL